ncbi:hypothetical protein SOASR015_42460 [Pectobacterium carotovorum subsp. carotovorum]|nr:hypothetical protein SOASR015_42460 [Pectobacterium carotovorum subsp. carotovorum]
MTLTVNQRTPHWQIHACIHTARCSEAAFGFSGRITRGRDGPPPRKRGPASRLEQQIEVISQFPKARQKMVAEMLDAVIAQAQQQETDS